MGLESFVWSEEIEDSVMLRKEVPETETPREIQSSEMEIMKELLQVEEEFVPLLKLIEQFSPDDDGIQFNMKLKHFVSTISSMCPEETQMQRAFVTFRAAALLDPETARQLAAVGAGFTSYPQLRQQLLNIVLQGTHAKLEELKRSSSPMLLINAANMMGDYFAAARLSNGQKVHFLAEPLLQYLRALLASQDIRAHRSLATQLMVNGRDLMSVVTQELDELSISIRLRLLSPPPVSTIWLLLSADICLNKFIPLPNTLQQFYAARPELTTKENFNDVSDGTWKTSPEKDTEIVTQNISQNKNEESKPKLKQEIGAGAGLLKQAHTKSLNKLENQTVSVTDIKRRLDLNSWRQSLAENKEDAPEVADASENISRMMSDNKKEDSKPKLRQVPNVGAGLAGVDIKRRLDLNSRRESLEEKKVESEVKVKDRDVRTVFVKLNRRSSREEVGTTAKATPRPRRHITEVPRSTKYWGHDDRCDKDYNT